MDFLSDDVRRDPFPLYARARKHLPVFQRNHAWMVFDFDTVKSVLSNADLFSSAVSHPGSEPAKWFIFLDPPRHTKLRALITKAFTPRLVAGLEPQIREIADHLLAAAPRELELAEAFSIPLPMMVIAGLLGIPREDWKRFHRWGDGILRLSYTISANEEEAHAAVIEYGNVSREMGDYLSEVLESRRERPRADLLTSLLESEVEGNRLSDADIFGFFQLLLVAGTETTTNLINNAVVCLLDNPSQFELLRANSGLLQNAIEEVLRYRSPVQWMFRAATREVVLQGNSIAPGSLVLPMIGSANRDERHFADSENFDITRDPNPHIAFGHGVHFCLGAALSKLEAKIALSGLLRYKIQYSGNGPWQPRKALHVHGPASLPVLLSD